MSMMGILSVNLEAAGGLWQRTIGEVLALFVGTTTAPPA